MPDPVAWSMIEHGWKVVGRDGEELGSVHEVIGDSNADIFNGLTMQSGLLKKTRYVPAERVAEIVEGQITLDLDEAELEALDEAASAGAV
jgi:uncharacterized protein YrrD